MINPPNLKTFTKLKFIASTAILCMIVNTLFAQPNPKENSKNVTLHFDNVVNGKPLVLGNGQFKNEANESFSITTFNYFISNISLVKENGEVFVVPQDDSYFLHKAVDSTTANMPFRLPDGKYQSISFLIGVDSVRNTMDISRRTGALDIAGGMLEGMYWTWNSGYIFLKIEGLSEQAPIDRTGQRKFRYHIGGFGGYDKPSLNNIRQVTLSLKEKGGLEIKGGSPAKINVQTNAAKVLNGKTNVSIAKNTQVMFGDFSSLIADNYAKMFSLLSVVDN